MESMFAAARTQQLAVLYVMGRPRPRQRVGMPDGIAELLEESRLSLSLVRARFPA
jgi:hypothetical protein